MKHPSIQNLQDYFENETKSSKSQLISTHVKSCDKCSLILSEMAKMDIIFSQSKSIAAPLNLRDKTLSKTNLILQKRREALKESQIEKKLKEERNEKVVSFVKNYKRSIFQDLKLPALQASALFILMGVITEISRTETITSEDKIINNEFKVFYSELEGDKNEDI
jgi:hypothetical protein